MSKAFDREVCEKLAAALEAGGRGFAGFASALLLEQRPELAGSADAGDAASFARWRDQFERIIIDIAVAVRFTRPELLASAMHWQRQAFVSRGFDARILRDAWTVLRDVFERHLPVSHVQFCNRFLDDADEILRTRVFPAEKELTPDTSAARDSLYVLQHLLEGDRRAAVDQVLNAVRGGMPLRTAYLDVVVPALREIGRMWHIGELSIAEEHLCTEAIRSLLAVLAHQAPTPAPNGWTAVVAAVPGNGHDLAVRIVSDFLEFEGFRPICLGADVPDSEVLQAVAFFEADIVVLSATLIGHLRSVRRTVDLLRREGPPNLRVIVGGGAFAAVPDLWRDLGADGWAAEADEAPLLARSLLAGGSPQS